jgi:glyoxylase-like metal-dependent hydrolase (beta-lactamase superfamily II)
VACFAVDAGSALLLVDPLLPAYDEGLLRRLDDLAGASKAVAILITIPYHTRSAEPLSERYDALIYGHPRVADRLGRRKRFRAIEPGAELPGGARAYAIGKPRRYEMPISLPSHRALAWGDALVTTLEGELRLWHWRDRVDEARARWYRERFAPTLEPLLDLDLERILVTHGPPILHDGAAALRSALATPPWPGH